MSLDDLRQKVAFHNSVDVWISACGERGAEWDDADAYGRFVAYLLGEGLNLKSFNLCAHDAGATDAKKTAFAERLAQRKDADPNFRNYTIRLSDSAVSVIRAYDFS